MLQHSPAPAVLQWLGWAGTSGHPRTHYAGVDAAIAPPPGAVKLFSERLVLLPGTYQANNHALKWAGVLVSAPPGQRAPGGAAQAAWRAEAAARGAVRAEELRALHTGQYGLEEDDSSEQSASEQPAAAGEHEIALLNATTAAHARVAARQAAAALLASPPARERTPVACSYNQFFKLSADIFANWRAILRRAAPAIMVQGAGVSAGRRISASDGAQMLHAAAHSDGVNANAQLFFAKALPKGAHLRRMSAMCDLALDTLHYNSHTTGADALWSGTPLVTLRGVSMASRVAASLSGAAGLADTTVFSHREYADFATALLRR